MESGRGRFRRADHVDDARLALREEILGLRRELELLDGVLHAGPTPISARASLDRSLFWVRAAERAWRASRPPRDLISVVEHVEAARGALEDSLDALRRRAVRAARAAH